MGKIRTRIVGDTAAEEEQKKKQKERSAKKKAASPAMKVQEEVAKAADETTAEEVVAPIEEAPKSQLSKKKKIKLRHKPGKKYNSAKSKVDGKKSYLLSEAIELLKSIAFADFEESVELHVNLENAGIRGEVELPHGTGKSLKITIVDDAVLEAIERGNIDFDVLVSHPSYMPKLAKFAKILGPRGLMPNPKVGTISPNPEEVVKKLSGGLTQWKSEAKFPIAHQIVGKLSYPADHLAQNIEAYLKSVGKKNIHSIYLKSSMSPSISVDMSVLA